MKDRTARTVPGMFARLWSHLGRHRWLYLLGTGFAVADAAAQTSVPMLFRFVINRLQSDAERFWSGPDHRLALWWAGGLALLVFGCAFGSHAFRLISMVRLERDLQRTLCNHIRYLSADFFQRHQVGEIAARANNDIELIGTSLGALGSLLYVLVVLVQGVAMMLWINSYLALLFIALMLTITLLSRSFLPLIRRLSRTYRDAAGETTAAITEYMGIHELIRAFSGEDFAAQRVLLRIDKTQRRAERLTWISSIFRDMILVLVRVVGPCLLLLAGAWLVSRHRLRLGDLIAYWGFWLMTGNGVSQLLNNFSTVFTGLASADRVFDFLDEQPLVKDAPRAKPLTKVRGEIVFDHVTFNYPIGSGRRVLDDVSFTLHPGSAVAFVGPSGAGKSTIMQLIMRIYDPLQGDIRIDGQSLRDVQQESLRQQIGVVMQESLFFSGTIEENLRLADPDATEQRMIAALKNANAWEFVSRMPGGLRAVIGERGARLSGGQKQRLSIARVFLKDPKIVLFDEATSALDTLSERLVQEAMKHLMRGRTTCIVAHRISTIREVDRIFIVENGCITASGPHEKLLERSSLYHDMHKYQLA